ncbi:PERM1 protein, partial [Pomatorhinus ruficollis]|nr:PERM1 protein [Pomatorhinus ruficollis]
MDNFEYSIQLNDREWAEFLRAAEECSLAPASLAEEEQNLGDIEPGDTEGRDCPRGGDSVTAGGPGSEPAPPGAVSAVPRGLVAGDIALSWPRPGHLSVSPELLSGSEDEAELGSVGRFLCDSDKDGCLSPPAMPSAQRRQPPRPPPAATAAGGAAQDTATGGGRDTEPSGAPEQGGDAGGGQMAQPAVVARPEAPAASAEKSAVPSEPRGDPSPSRVAAEGDRAGTEPSSPGGSPSVVRPKVPAQPRKSRRQRGASATEGDKDAAGAATPAGAGKAPPGSPMSPRKGKGKDKAAKAALVRLGSEEAAESKRPVPGPGGDGPDPGAAPQKQRGKEPQSPGKTKATKSPRAGQAGGSGVRDTVPAVPAPGGECQDMPGKPLRAGRAAALGGNAAEEPAAEIPGIPAAEIPGIPAAEIPRKASEIPGIPAAEIPGIPATEIPRKSAAEIPGVPAAEIPRKASEIPGIPAAEIPRKSAAEIPKKPSEIPAVPAAEIPKKASEIPGIPAAEIPGVPAAEIPKKASEIPGIPAADIPADTVVIPVPDVYEHFHPQRPQNRMGWRGIFSMPPASEVKKAVGALRALLQRQMQLGGGRAPSSSQALVPRRSGEKLALVPLGGAQVWPQDADTALALTGAAEDPRVLSHKDMCLVFCAFASWAVKTSDLQAPDAWKT